MEVFNRMKKEFLNLIEEKQVGTVPVKERVRGFTAQEAIGNPEHQDYPLVKRAAS